MRILYSVMLALYSFQAAGQAVNEVPQVGKPLPDLVLIDVRHSQHKAVTNRTFEGNWTLLYLWSLGCPTSVKDILRMDSIQKEVGHVQVFLIGNTKHRFNDGIEDVFERLRHTHRINLPVAFDSILFDKWNIFAVPYVFAVDPKGIVRHVTTGFDMTIDKVMAMVRGEAVRFHPVEPDYNETSNFALLKDSVLHKKLHYASVLTRWNGERPEIGYEIDRFVRLPKKYQEEGWSVSKMSLERLYLYAYVGRALWSPYDTSFYGKVFTKPIIEVENNGPFEHNAFTGVGMYNYYLKMPLNRITLESMKGELQEILSLNFGYDARMETRLMPVWKLIASEAALKKLRSRGGKPVFLGDNPIAGVAVRNYPVEKFLFLVTTNLPNHENLPYVDSTGIEDGIDCNIKTDMTDFDSVQNALLRYGLRLVRGVKEMKVVVITD